MNAKEIALVIAFATIAIILNPSISKIGLAFPPVPSLIINAWEIPVIIAFLMMGFRYGILVAAINALFLFAVWPGPSNPIYPVGCIISAFSMMLGIFMFSKFGSRPSKPIILNSKKSALYSTVAAIIPRILLMAPIMYAIIKLSAVDFPDRIIFGFVLPWQAVYNIIQPLITIPIAFFIASKLKNAYMTRLATNGK
jgi:riboflavin transporter FmnP